MAKRTVEIRVDDWTDEQVTDLVVSLYPTLLLAAKAAGQAIPDLSVSGSSLTAQVNDRWHQIGIDHPMVDNIGVGAA
jgi:hypothetical protein